MSALHHFDEDRFYAAQRQRMAGKIDSIAIPGVEGRQDGAVIFERLTRATNAMLHEYVYRATPWASEVLITPDTSLPVGTSSVDEYSVKDIDAPGDGFASEDAPMPKVDVGLEAENVRLHSVPVAYDLTMGEVEKWALQGFGDGLPSRKAAAAGRYWHRKVDAAIRSGVTGKFRGVLDYQGSLQLVAGTAANTTASWANATPDQIIDSFAAVRQAIDDAGDDLSPNTCVMPTSLRATMKKQRSIGSDTTIEMWLRANFPEIDLWVWDRNMNTAGLESNACMLLYDRNPETLWFHMPMRMQPTPEFTKHTLIEQGFRTWLSGPFCTRPRTIARLSGI
jgi:hypothetical protein